MTFDLHPVLKHFTKKKTIVVKRIVSEQTVEKTVIDWEKIGFIAFLGICAAAKALEYLGLITLD